MKLKRILSIVLIVVFVAAFMVIPVFALQDNPPTPAPAGIDYLLQVIFGLSITVPGAALLGTMIINLIKIPGWVTDGSAPFWSNVVNVVFALFIGFASLFTSWNIPGLDTKFADLANTLAILLPVFVLLYKWLAPIFHGALRGFPLIGYSHSMKLVKKK